MTRTGVFVVATGAVIGWELWASLRRDPRNRTWTSLLVEHVPWPVSAVAAGLLLLWLPPHLYRSYRHALDTAASTAVDRALDQAFGEAA